MSINTGLNPRLGTTTKFPHWERPNPISCFSVNSERCYESDCRNLRYLMLPQKFPLNLNTGIELAKKKPDKDEGIDFLLEHIMATYVELIKTFKISTDCESHERQKKPLCPIEFVAWRGLLRLIMCTPFEQRKNWIIDVTHYKGTFYFCERETEEARFDRLNATPIQNRMQAWGYKFEQYCLTKSPESEPDTDSPVDECAELSCVFHTKIDGFHLLYGAEMDGVRSKRIVDLNVELQNAGNINFIELKTSLQNMNHRQMRNFQRFKTRNWWCQSFLVGIEDIIVGWRDDEGLIHDIEIIKVSQLAKQGKCWSASECAQFLVSFLNCVKTVMANIDCPYTVFEFQYDAPRSHIGYDVFEGLTDKTILPDYFVHFLERLNKQKNI